MYIIVLQCKIAPSTYVETVPNKQHIPNPELNVVLHLESETSVTYAYKIALSKYMQLFSPI